MSEIGRVISRRIGDTGAEDMREKVVMIREEDRFGR